MRTSFQPVSPKTVRIRFGAVFERETAAARFRSLEVDERHTGLAEGLTSSIGNQGLAVRLNRAG